MIEIGDKTDEKESKQASGGDGQLDKLRKLKSEEINAIAKLANEKKKLRSIRAGLRNEQREMRELLGIPAFLGIPKRPETRGKLWPFFTVMALLMGAVWGVGLVWGIEVLQEIGIAAGLPSLVVAFIGFLIESE